MINPNQPSLASTDLPQDALELSPTEVESISNIIPPEDLMDIEEDVLFSDGGVDHFGNLVDLIEESEDGIDLLNEIGQQVVETFEQDKMTRSALEDTVIRGFETFNPNSGATKGNLPFEGACEIVHPLIRENAIKYQAKFCKALLPPQGPFKMDIEDVEVPNIENLARKLEKKLNKTAKRVMRFDREQAKNFLYFTLAGTSFKKVYFDRNTRSPKSEFVRLEHFVVSDLAKDLVSAESYTHVIIRRPEELKRDIANGVYKDILSEISTVNPEEDALASATADAMDEPEISTNTEAYELLEQYCYLDLSKVDPSASGITYALPYQVTVDKQSKKVLSIRRNWKAGDSTFTKIVNFFEYIFVPGTGFYGLGLFHLLSDFQQTLTAIVRSLVDSASFANLQAGFKKKGLRLVGDNGPLKPGEFREIDTLDSSKIQDVLYMVPFKEPSQTLFNLMQDLTAQGQKFADNLDQAVNESVNYGKVGTTLAILEESAGFFSSIFQRVYGYMWEELSYIAELASDQMGPEFEQAVNIDGSLNVVPASDPNYPTRAHQLQLAQSKLNLALQSPQTHNMAEVFRTFYRSLGESEDTIARILPQPTQAQPLSPLEDIVAASNGTPIKAFEGQDHDAHIAVKTMYIQDPMNQNQVLQQIFPVLQANIKEHMVLKYVEQMKGLIPPDQAVSEQAQQMAAQQILQANQMAAQLQASGGLENPDMIYAQAEMKKADVLAEKEQFDQKIKTVNTILDARKLDLEAKKVEEKTKHDLLKLSKDALSDYLKN